MKTVNEIPLSVFKQLIRLKAAIDKRDSHDEIVERFQLRLTKLGLKRAEKRNKVGFALHDKVVAETKKLYELLQEWK